MTDYATLQSDVAEWLNRDDLTDRIPTFIQLAEARFNRALRVMAMVSRAQTEADRDFIPLPTDWLETRNIQLDGAPVGYVTPEEADRLRDKDLLTSKLFYTLIDDGIELVPEPDSGTLLIAYYASIPALSDSNTENWLLTKHYDAYLYGALVHSAPFLVEDERLPVWKTSFTEAINEIQAADERAKHSGATLIPRRRGGYG